MKVVVCLPTYNERDNIGRLIDGLNAERARVPHEFEILVVDDDSPDGTQDIVREAQSRYDNVRLLTGTKQGLGMAYARGLRHAMDVLGADIVMHMDADFSHDPAIMPKLVAQIDAGHDLTVGSRYVEGGKLGPDWGWQRRIISRVANSGIRVIAGITQLNDCTSGYRAYRATMLRHVDLDAVPHGYAALTFLAYQSLMAGATVAEVPITFSNRVEGTSKLRSSDAIELFLNAWWIRYDRRDRFVRRASGGLSGVAVNLGALAALHLAAGMPAAAASALAIEASVLFSFGWRRMWGRALGRSKGGALAALGRTHVWAIPSFALTLGVFLALHRAGVHPLVAQAVGIVPAMVWNYFIGDRMFDILRGTPAADHMSEPSRHDEARDVLS